MTVSITVPNTFANQSGNVPASELDANFSALASAFALFLSADGTQTPTAPLSYAQPLTLQPASGVALTLDNVSGQDALDINLAQAAGVGWALNITGSINTDVRGIQITNTNTGNAAGNVALAIANNTTNETLIGKTGGNFSGARFSGGPVGEVSYFYSGGAIPIVFAYGPGGSPTCSMYIGGAGTVIINPPSVGTSLSINTNTGANAIQVTDGTHTAAWIVSASAGVEIQLGTTTAHGLSIFTNNANRININNAGNIVLPAPSSGVNMTINGVSGGTPMVLVPGNASAPLGLGTPVGGGSLVSCMSIASNYAGTGAQTATFSATNKPGSGTTAPDLWLVIQVGGTTRYIPTWQ